MPVQKTHSLIDLAKEVTPAHAALLDTVALRLTEAEGPGYGVSATHTQFWKADYTIHLRKNIPLMFGRFLPEQSEQKREIKKIC